MPTVRDKLIEFYPNLSYHLGFGPEPQANLEDIESGDPGFSPAGMVINPRNAKIIAGRMANFIVENSGKRLSPAQMAIAYVKAKYPKLSSIPKEIAAESLPQNIYGQFQSGANKVVVNPLKMRRIEDIVSTLGHELTHATQYFKDNKAFANYIKAHRRTLERFEKYRQQPVEVLADQGGATAKRTFEKYLQMLNQ